jgi:hypothetical protein
MGVWYRGRYGGAGVYGSVRSACARPSAECWGEFIDGRGARAWWFQVRLDDGTEGWSNQGDHFLTYSDAYRESVEDPRQDDSGDG